MRDRRLWPAILAVVALIAIGLGCGYYLYYRAGSTLRAISKRADSIEQELQKRAAARLPLHAEFEPGNAWDSYTRAVHNFLSTGATNEFSALRSFAQRGTLDGADAVVEKYATTIQELRRGTRQRPGLRPVEHPNIAAQGHGGPPLLIDIDVLLHYADDLVALLVLQAHVHRHHGRAEEAVDLLLDACTFGRDCSYQFGSTTSGSVINASAKSFPVLRDMILGRELSVERLLRLERRLAALFDMLPDAGVPDAAYNGAQARAFLTGNGYLNLTEQEYERLMRATEQQLTSDGLPWLQLLEDRKRIIREHGPSLRLDPAPVLPLWCKASVQLLRAAALCVAGAKTQDLVDPFGTKLLQSRAEGRTRIWSIGPDGRDDGGKGEAWVDDRLPGLKPDIVLDIGQ